MAEKYQLADDDGVERSDDGVDSQEQLEADILKRAAYWSYDDYADTEQIAHLREKFIAEAVGWLDRQAAITEQECQASITQALQERYKALNRVAELKDELEALRKRANDAERGVLDERWYVSRDRYEDDIAELKAERDRLNEDCSALDKQCIALEERVDILTAERDKLNTRCYALETEQADLREKVARQRIQLGELQDAIRARNQGELKRQWQRQVDDLTAERDHYRKHVNHLIALIADIARKQPQTFDPEAPYETLDAIGDYIDELRRRNAELECERCDRTFDIGRHYGKAKERIAELEAELERKQHVCDVQRDSFLKLEVENAELRKAGKGNEDA